MKRYLHPHILKLLSTSNSSYKNSYFVCYTIPNFDLGIINDYARIYVLITDKSCSNDNVLFGDLLKLSRTNNEIWLHGIDDFKPGVDYFLNTSLSNYYNNTNPNIVLPDYIYNSSFTNNWLCCDVINFDYYNKLNKLLVSSFTESEFDNFYLTFCNIILKNSTITDDMMLYDNNNIYKIVLEYYANGQSNSAIVSMELIMNTLYATGNNTTGCGCNSIFNDLNSMNNKNLISCSDLYKEAMFKYLQQMLGDDNFYKNWLYIYNEDGSKLVNEAVVSNLINFIDEFLNLGYSLVFTKQNNKNCECPIINIDESLCNTKIIEKYKSVLNFVRTNTIEYNINKIKVYGSEFGKILPNLHF